MCISTCDNKSVIELLIYFKDSHYSCGLFENGLEELKGVENKYLSLIIILRIPRVWKYEALQFIRIEYSQTFYKYSKN